jgi:hypothetical protein
VLSRDFFLAESVGLEYIEVILSFLFIIVIIIRNQLGIDRTVSASSNSLLKNLPN